ncbi:MAG TPA: magnesium transporter [Gammaproteobacteria bacterium]|nr:magnesium transporter [Gammaproteobacteria bacterium]
MTPDAALTALNHRFLTAHPAEAAGHLESMPPDAAAALLAAEDPAAVFPVWDHLTPGRGAELMAALDPGDRHAHLAAMEPARAARLLASLEPEVRQPILDALGPGLGRELSRLLSYPEGSAGQLMDPRIPAFPRDLAVGAALTRLRTLPGGPIATVFIKDRDGRLSGRVDLRDLALAGEERTLGELAAPVPDVVSEFAPREELVDRLEHGGAGALPVVDFNGQLVGVLRQSALVAAVQADASADLTAMVGASREEGALSPAVFSVSRRLPWMLINLATAFLAAGVVGLFETTIAQFTALAVLLPVVAGQSGNAGAQALAITMRGLALREITVRHALRVVFKEMRVGLLNGVAIAAVTAAGVYWWSASTGLALIISLAMVIAMVAAGTAGALIPIGLTRIGQDPAQSSSILLTTVTDVVGFVAFLGIATLLAHLI